MNANSSNRNDSNCVLLRGLKHVIGDGPSPRGGNMAMALRVAAHARALGCRAIKIRHSRVLCSNSVYIFFTCPGRRPWLARIADHHRPQRAAVPNFDLVSRDAKRGEEWLMDCISAASVGAVEWFDSVATASPPSARELKRIAKSKPRNLFTGFAAKHLPC